MCDLNDLNPFGGGSSGGSAQSASTSQSAQSTTVNVSTPVNLAVNTSDLAHALEVLSGQQFASSVVSAAATVQAAKIAANAGPNVYVIGGAIIAVLGLLFTAGIIKVPKGLRV